MSVVAGLLALILGASVATAQTSSNDVGEQIVAAAMADLGTNQGQCFPWVRRVVQSVTGRALGFGYREAYLTGGAVEISLDQLRPGDIIQIADDNDLSAGADYPGLHTSIVVQSQGGGRYQVIDSNSLWDGVVRLRNDYDPLQLAARYPNLTARAYRFGGGGNTPIANFVPNQQESGTAALTPGGTARVDGDGGCVNLRSNPGTSAGIVICLPDGTTVTVLEGTVAANGYTWQRVQVGSFTGWMADEFLVELTSGPAPTPQPTAPPSVTPTPAPTSTPPPSSSTGTIGGSLPTNGGYGLIVWGGGSIQSLVNTAGAGNCPVRSVWSTVGGGFLGYTAGAPAFVNAAWNQRFPGEIAAQTPFIVVCGGGGSSSPPPSSGGSLSAPVDGDPPGPAGNED